MAAPFEGGCACGAIRYRCGAEPLLSVLCHCRDCQRSTGSGHAAELVVPRAAFAFLRGEPRYHRVTGNSGNVVSRGFCGDCGSPISADSSGFPEMLALQAGSLDVPAQFRPTHHVYASSAQPWDHVEATATAFARIPDFQQIVARLIEKQVTTTGQAVQAIQEMFASETQVSEAAAGALLGVLRAGGFPIAGERES